MKNLKPSSFSHPIQLDDDRLVTILQEIACTERQWQVRGLVYLAEVEKRRIHLKLGYRSLYEFCVNRLKWSEGSVYRRIQIARRAREVPGLLQAIRAQKLTLTVASQIAPHLTPENAAKMIGEYSGLSRRQAEDRLACSGSNTNALGSQRESVRSLGLHPVAPQPSGSSVSQPNVVSNPALGASSATATGPGSVSTPISKSAPAQTTQKDQDVRKVEIFSFRFSGRATLRDKLERAKAVMASKLDDTSMENVLEAALDCLLEKHDPKRKADRAKKRLAKAEAVAAAKSNSKDKDLAKTPASSTAKVHDPKSPYISAALRMKTLERAGYRCEWETDGRRCPASGNLQVDHRIPFAKGGLTVMANVQALCRAHNLMKARLDYGDAKIDQAIRTRRTADGHLRNRAGQGSLRF